MPFVSKRLKSFTGSALWLSLLAAAPALADNQFRFTLEKETTGALRYVQEGFDAKDMDATFIGTMYLRKSHIDGTDYPQSIVVTVDF